MNNKFIINDFNFKEIDTLNYQYIFSIKNKIAINSLYHRYISSLGLPIDFISIKFIFGNSSTYISNLDNSVVIPYAQNEIWRYDNSFDMLNHDIAYFANKQTPFQKKLYDIFKINNYCGFFFKSNQYTISFIFGVNNKNIKRFLGKNEVNQLKKSSVLLLEKLKPLMIDHDERLRYSSFNLCDTFFKDLLLQLESLEENLSSGELLCLFWVSEGLKTNDISVKTGYSINTVNSYIKSVKKKLNTKTITEAVKIAIIHGLIL